MMKTIKHSILGVLLILATTTFAQTQTQTKIHIESFKVNKDVIVEIDVRNTDVIVEHWNKKEVLVESVLEIEGLTNEESEEYFNGWKIEAIGNSSKVVVSSKQNFYFEDLSFLELAHIMSDVKFDFEPIVAYSLSFDSVSFPSPPEIPKVAVKILKKFEWDQEAYEQDREKYLKEFEIQQEAWAKEIEEKYEPMMDNYEKRMEEWSVEFSEKFEPKMKEYEKEMEKWEKEFEEKLAPQSKKIEERLAVQIKEIETKTRKIEIKFEEKQENILKMKKKITIKIPKGARVKVKNFESTVNLPTGVKKV